MGTLRYQQLNIGQQNLNAAIRAFLMLFKPSKRGRHEIAEAADMSTERVLYFLYKYLGMGILSARLAPRLLSVDRKHDRPIILKECLAIYNRDKIFFRFVIVGNTINMDPSQYPGDQGTI